MKLYHGTSSRHLEAILRDGLKPRRGRRTAGNWKHTTTSVRDHVYLTNAYAIHFAWCACRPNIRSDELVIIEIDTTEINPFLLYPDEDFMAHAFGDANKPQLMNAINTARAERAIAEADFSTLQARTKFFRDNIEWFNDYWQSSLNHLGNCSFNGTITPSAFTRYARIKQNANLRLLSDPCITLVNYKIKGAFYRALTARAFGDEPEHLIWDYERESINAAKPGKVITL